MSGLLTSVDMAIRKQRVKISKQNRPLRATMVYTPCVHLDILPVKLCDIERLDCVKLLGVFIDSKLLLSGHVERLLGVCNQRDKTARRRHS